VLVTRGAVIRLAVLSAVLTLGILFMLHMPGHSYRGPLPGLDKHQQSVLVDLRRDLTRIADEIGERNLECYPALVAAAEYLEQELQATGLGVTRHTYKVMGRDCHNLVAELPGRRCPDQIVVIGGHYDSASGTKGADDNGSGAVALLALARALAGKPQDRTLRFVAFTNEEPPHFMRSTMGSYVYAQECRRRKENIVAMLSLEMLGFYTSQKRSQKYPPPLSLLYPDTGDFVAFVSNLGSRRLTRQALASFRRQGRFPSEGAVLPAFVPGIGWSDHWAFWNQGYRATMVTDTAFFRNPFYHTPQDTIGTIDFERLARVVTDLEAVVAELGSTTAFAP
jgi:hypothetical protein